GKRDAAGQAHDDGSVLDLLPNLTGHLLGEDDTGGAAVDVNHDVLAFLLRWSEPALERVSELLRGASLDGSALRPLGEVGLGGRRTLRLRQLSESLSLLTDGVLVTASEEHLGVPGGDLELG